jgi:hypothetical protein
MNIDKRIVEILTYIEPLKIKASKEKVSLEIRHNLEVLQNMAAITNAPPPACKESFRRLASAADKLREAISDFPVAEDEWLFPGVVKDGKSDLSREELLFYIECVRNRARYFVNFKYNLRDFIKQECAGFAFILVLSYSKNAPTGTQYGPLQTVAGLLYEQTLGTKATLKRACDRIVAERRMAVERYLRRMNGQVKMGSEQI